MSINFKILIKAFIIFCLFVVFTQTYVVIANSFNTSVGSITLFIFIGIIFYLNKLNKNVLKKDVNIIYIIFFFILPITISLINGVFHTNFLILQLFYYLLVLFSFDVYINYRVYLKVTLKLAIIFNFFAGLISIFFPFLFVEYSEIVDSGFFY